MCGIAGYYNTSGKNVGNTSTVLQMLDLQKHRGPDDSGIRAFSLINQQTEEFSNRQPTETSSGYEGVVGFNRLSILDLSVNGHQPMSSNDGKIMLAFNGEIYNAFDYKDELIGDGCSFKSTSDTEIILNLYLKYGFDGLMSRLNGMFAIVLADVREQKLFLARDRFGIKPLYLFETSEVLAFSSEIKSFLAMPEFKARLNAKKLDEFLVFRNVINETLFEGVEALEPGSYKMYTPHSVRTVRYFEIDSYERTTELPSTAESQERLRSSLKSSVHRQLLSDVKLGCQLSGGIDSSLVTALAKEIKQDDLLETISVTFDNPMFNEEPFVDQVTKRLKLTAHKFPLTSSYYLKQFEKATWHFEAPINHPNTIGIYLLSQKAKEYVKVLLSGEGADEVFGGYSRFGEVMHPFAFRTLASRLKKDFTIRHVAQYSSSAYRATIGSTYMSHTHAKRVMPSFSAESALCKRNKIYKSLNGSAFDKQVKFELLTYLPDLLMRQDKMSMAHSIENRVPFLDNILVAESFQIPVEHLVGNTPAGEQNKLALKKLAATWFGDSFVYRSKGGFGIPLRDFFRDSQFQQYMSDQVIPGMRTRAIFNVELVAHWSKNISTISSQELDALWIMIAFEVWASLYKL